MFDFCRRLPACCGEDGLPRSWRHYVYGRRHLGRADARAELSRASTARLGQATSDDFRDFKRLVEPYTR